MGCLAEAFWSRSLPLAVTMGGGAHALVKIGRLPNPIPSHPKFGSLLHVLNAANIGLFIGRISYQSKLENKLMADPNSLLGRSLRQKQGQTLLEPTDPAVIDMIQKRDSPAATRVSRESPAAADVIDMIQKRESPSAARVSRESPAAADVNAASGNAASGKAASGYDQLRQRNRQYRSSPPPSAPAPPPNASPLQPEFPSEDAKIDEVLIEEKPTKRRMPTPKPKTNKYGDVIEDD